LSRADEAVSTFQQGFSCSQAVLLAFAPELGLERDQALKISGAFGAGMGRLGEVCGALTGAFMTIGLIYGRTRADDEDMKEQAYAHVAELAAEFRRRHGSVRCRDLLGCDLGTPEGRQFSKEHGLSETRCTQFVRDAAEIAETMLR